MDPQRTSKINYIFVPTLKHLALVKTASTLWNKNNVRDQFCENFSCDGISQDDMQVAEDAINKKVPELQLPIELGKMLISYIHHIGNQILDWINFHVKCGYITLTELPSEFFWTPQGTIDNKKIAETFLVNDERLSIYNRFKLSCIYCLEQYIKILSKELPKGFHKEQNVEAIVKVWSYYISGEIDQLLYIDLTLILALERVNEVTFSQLGFLVSVATGNEAGTKYFLHRLTPEGRAKCLVKSTVLAYKCCILSFADNTCFSKCHYSNNLCYLLSEMNENQQRKLVVKLSTSNILQYLLNWPWQDFFLKTANKIRRYVYPEDYYSILKSISKKMISRADDFDYRSLFGKIWQQGPFAYKRYVIINGGLLSLLPALLAEGDKENAKLILKVATVVEKEEFIMSPPIQIICCILVRDCNWKLLKFFVKECTLSKEVFHELKERLSGFFFISFVCIKKDEDNWNELCQLLSDIEQENERKCIDEAVNSSS